MATSKILVDRALAADGESLAQWRANGLTLAEIVFQLRARYDVQISTETVRRWTSQEAS